jgi:hypothetical protein
VAEVPALDPPEPVEPDPETDDDGELPVHPSRRPWRPDPARRPRNRPGTWRWARPGALLALVAGTGTWWWESWSYTGRALLPGGTTRGPEFSW